ncbi:unknown [Firmicutes bacterium CAG:822]|nr:unknown [Firmicutes bacterium CAG:822]
MKTKKKGNQRFENVALYIRYEDGDLDEMKKKEEILVKYCEEHNCNIVKKYFDSNGCYFPYFSNTMRNFLRNIGNREFDYLITCDVNDLTECLHQLVAIYTILEDEDTKIITINQGTLGEDMLLDGTFLENVMNKKELQNPRVKYDENGKFIDTEEDPF